ncbi:hypothetical protein P692DRAFT_20518202 [Suillus brevipes Sb2]|nr:hypothetical protein P692DRAFT_20518202 [Suillus brevipes Sb2]
MSTASCLTLHSQNPTAHFHKPCGGRSYVCVIAGEFTCSLFYVIHVSVSHVKDEIETFSSSISGATSFLLSLASNRTKRPSSRCSSSLTLPCAQILHRLGFSALLRRCQPLAPSSFATLMSKGSIEQFMVQYILPEFTSQ